MSASIVGLLRTEDVSALHESNQPGYSGVQALYIHDYAADNTGDVAVVRLSGYSVSMDAFDGEYC